MFTIGSAYTRADIHARVGGSRVSCLPMSDGAVVAVCVTRVFNPDAPAVILCGKGTRTGPTSDVFAHQRQAVPVFVKLKANQWIYQGRFVVAESLTTGVRFRHYIEGSGRTIASVSVIVLLEPAA